jgi:beta-N-acetylhexosaminidase
MHLLQLPLVLLLSAASACSQPDAPARPAGASPAADTLPRVEPLPVDSAGRAWVEATLARMTLRQRVAQLVFPWVSGRGLGETPSEEQRMVGWARNEQVGGLVISTGRAEALAAKLNAAQSASSVPLLILSDLETGPGMRLRPGGTLMPPAMAFGAGGDTALARQAGRATAEEARAVGIHATLGPLLDVQTDANNPIINVRSFGGDPAAVGRLASAWLSGARQGGLLTIGKHFPGHGGTRGDSHVGRTSVAGDLATLRRTDMAPFRDAIRAGLSGVLVGHIAAVGVEGPSAPVASLSPRMVQGELRGEMGFRGLVVTDALNMGGVTREMSPAEAGIRALLAGADILLQPPGPDVVIDRVVQAVESGRVPASRVEDAARRVLTAKAAAGIHRGARVDVQAVAARVGTSAHREIARRVAERGVTVARDGGRLLPLRRGMRVLHLAYGAAGADAAGVLRRDLEAGGVDVRVVRVSPGSTVAQLRDRVSAAGAADVVLATASVTPVQYQSLGLRGGFAPMVEELARAGRPVIVVSLGSPYIIGGFPSVGSYVLGWSSDSASERAVAQVLLGARRATGTMPVRLP